MENHELVFIPSPGVGHINSTIEVAKLITDLRRDFSATILVTRQQNDKKPIPESSNPRVKFMELVPEDSSSADSHGQYPLFRQLEERKPHVREILAGMKNFGTAKLAGIVIDMFCITMIDVADEFGVPSYLYFTSGAAFLGLMFHKQSLSYKLDESEPESEIVVGTYMNPVPLKVLPRAFFAKDGDVDVCNLLAGRFRETKGILVNTFQELEGHAMQDLMSNASIPPVYAVGPVLKLENIPDQNSESETILKWLDLQPDSSVIFLCFGSMGAFGDEQVKQIAQALENSGCRFLWSLRKPPSKEMSESSPKEYENLEEVLPAGFLQRISDVGKVIGWAPQTEILSHRAVGGFVSHCGWNSTLESVWFGVPMATWPLYAEQQANSFLLVKDLEMAVEIKMDYVLDFESKTVNLNNIVSADVIENGIKKLMDLGNLKMSKKVIDMQEKSRLAVKEDGSSFISLKGFLEKVLENIP